MRLCPAHNLRRRSLSAYALARDAYSAPGLVVLRIFCSHILKEWTRLLGWSAIASLRHHRALEYDPFLLLPERLERARLPSWCPIRMVAVFHESTGQPLFVQDYTTLSVGYERDLLQARSCGARIMTTECNQPLERWDRFGANR